MLTMRLICIGKLKEHYWQEACREYQKRLGAFCRLELIELNEYKLPSSPSESQITKCIEEEGREILAKLRSGYHIALCIEGKELSSEQLAEKFSALALNGVSEIDLIIGGSYGLSKEVKVKADQKLSMSPMTFPHQMARVMLLEQVYRAFQINANGKYHK